MNRHAGGATTRKSESSTVGFEVYAWYGQVFLSLLFAAHLARFASRKRRHPVGAALLMLSFVNGWPIVTAAIGSRIGDGFALNESARLTMTRVFGLGGIIWGVAWSYAIVGCLKPGK
jgi:hypothetical protein